MRCKDIGYPRPPLVEPAKMGTVQRFLAQQPITATAMSCSEGE
jgi:hypothetical protein